MRKNVLIKLCGFVQRIILYFKKYFITHIEHKVFKLIIKNPSKFLNLNLKFYGSLQLLLKGRFSNNYTNCIVTTLEFTLTQFESPMGTTLFQNLHLMQDQKC